jgi:hypothetical protein
MSRRRAKVAVDRRPLPDKTRDAITALGTANVPPSVFIRGGHLIRVRERDGRPGIEVLREHELRGLLARSADFVSDGNPISPPMDIVRDVLTVGEWPFPRLEVIVEAPVLRADGSVLDVAGYDSQSAILYVPAPGLVVSPVPAQPTRAVVNAARALLAEELLGDFPFVDDASRANALALAITPIVRPMIDGPVPLALLDKPQPGTGASLLAEVVAILATGRPGAMMSEPGSDEEWRKQITSVLLDAATFILIDNVDGALRSKSLARALTSTTWKDRILGKSATVELPQRAVWVATGNNLRVGGDLARRCYRIRIDAGMARPYLRDESTFRHSLPLWAIQHRGELLAAILTLVRAWVAEGRPPAKTPTIGGFTAWAKAVGAILVHAGVAGFLDNVIESYEDLDEDAAAWEAFLAEWSRTFGNKPVTVAAVEAEMRAKTSGLRKVVPRELDLALDGQLAKALGYALRKRADQVIGDFKITQAGKHPHMKVARWRVMRVMAGNVSAPTTAEGNREGGKDQPPSPASPASSRNGAPDSAGGRCRECSTPLPSGWGPVRCARCGWTAYFTPLHLAREET